MDLSTKAASVFIAILAYDFLHSWELGDFLRPAAGRRLSRIMRALVRCAGCTFVFLGACSTGTTTAGGAPASDASTTLPSNDGGTTGPADGATTSAPPTDTASAKARCQRLVACLNESKDPSAGAKVVLYGEASNCWKGSLDDALACGQACSTELEVKPAEYGKYPSCGCTTSAECSTARVCVPRGRCVDEDDAIDERLRDANACQTWRRLANADCPAIWFEEQVGCAVSQFAQRFRATNCGEKIAAYYECTRTLMNAPAECFFDSESRREPVKIATACKAEATAALACAFPAR